MSLNSVKTFRKNSIVQVCRYFPKHICRIAYNSQIFFLWERPLCYWTANCVIHWVGQKLQNKMWRTNQLGYQKDFNRFNFFMITEWSLVLDYLRYVDLYGLGYDICQYLHVGSYFDWPLLGSLLQSTLQETQYEKENYSYYCNDMVC